MSMRVLPVCGPEGPLRPVAASAPPPVRGVLFDFSGTLFQIDTYANRVRAVMARDIGRTEMEALIGGLERGLSDPAVVRAQHDRDVSAQAHRHAFVTWYMSVPALAPFAEALYEQLQAPRHWMPYADALPTLTALARHGIALGVVSDIGWDLRDIFRWHGLEHFFTAWVHSYEHGTEKPDPLLFQHACDAIGVTEAETLMVGDHPARDGGAAGAGLRSYVLPAGAAPGAHRGLDAVRRIVGLDA